MSHRPVTRSQTKAQANLQNIENKELESNQELLNLENKNLEKQELEIQKPENDGETILSQNSQNPYIPKARQSIHSDFVSSQISNNFNFNTNNTQIPSASYSISIPTSIGSFDYSVSNAYPQSNLLNWDLSPIKTFDNQYREPVSPVNSIELEEEEEALSYKIFEKSAEIEKDLYESAKSDETFPNFPVSIAQPRLTHSPISVIPLPFGKNSEEFLNQLGNFGETEGIGTSNASRTEKNTNLIEKLDDRLEKLDKNSKENSENPLNNQNQGQLTGSDGKPPGDNNRNNRNNNNLPPNPSNTVAIMAITNSQTVSLKDALLFVPEFDGKTIALSEFIDGCEEARQSLPAAAEANLVKVLRTKLIKGARKPLLGKTFDTCEEFYKTLKGLFTPPKPSWILQGDLTKVYQKDNEKVLEFATRVRELGKLVIETYKAEKGDASAEYVNNIEQIMLLSFLNGLVPEIEQRVDKKETIENAVENAIKIECDLQTKRALRNQDKPAEKKTVTKTVLACEPVQNQTVEENQNPSQSNNTNQNENQNSNQPKNANQNQNKQNQNSNKNTKQGVKAIQSNEVTRNQKICQICAKTGHEAPQCFQRYRQNSNPPQVNQTPFAGIGTYQNPYANTMQTTPIQNQVPAYPINNVQGGMNARVICQVCGKPNHDATRCYMVIGRPNQNNYQQNTQMQNPIPQTANCQLCGANNHLARNCPTFTNKTTTNTGNQNFPVNTNNNAGSFSPPICNNCGNPGHYARFCMYPPITGEYCGRLGHGIQLCRTRQRNEGFAAGNAKGSSQAGAQGDPQVTTTRPAQVVNTITTEE